MIKSILIKIIVNLLLVGFIGALVENITGMSIADIIASLTGETTEPTDPETSETTTLA